MDEELQHYRNHFYGMSPDQLQQAMHQAEKLSPAAQTALTEEIVRQCDENYQQILSMQRDATSVQPQKMRMMCRAFLGNSCPLSEDECEWSHDEGVCPYYLKGNCKYGKQCVYYHVCLHFMNGQCKFGESCRLEHRCPWFLKDCCRYGDQCVWPHE